MVFMHDITVTKAYYMTKLRWWINYVNKYEDLYPHLSRNKAFNLSTNLVVDNEMKEDEKTLEPSFAEKLRYNLLTLFFKKPKGSDSFIGDNDNEDILTSVDYTNIRDETVDERDNESQEDQVLIKEVKVLSRL